MWLLRSPFGRLRALSKEAPLDREGLGSGQGYWIKRIAEADMTNEARSEAPIDTASGGASPFRNFVPYTPGSDEEYMNPDQVAHFRHILNEWRRELMEQVDRTVNQLQDEASNFPDELDRATREEELGIELRTRDRERRLIRKINETLDRMDRKDYGYCDTCGVEIGLRRLEARPTATQCVDCKSLDELREKQLRG